MKANVDDISKTISEVAVNIESWTTYEEVQKMINEKLWPGVFGSIDDKSSSRNDILSLRQEI